MPSRRKKSLQHGSAKFGTVIWHHEHRSKKNRRRIHWSVEYHIKMYKKRKLALLMKEQDQEMSDILRLSPESKEVKP